VRLTKVAIIVLNWNGWRDTIPCVASLTQLNTTDIGIFVCDNASSDDSIERIRSWLQTGLEPLNAARRQFDQPAFAPIDLSDSPTDGNGDFILPDNGRNRITLIQTGRNGGYAAGNNVGIRIALANGFDYVWIINNDTEVPSGSVNALLSRMEEDPKIGLCGSTLIYHGQRDMVQVRGGATFNPLRGWGRAIGARDNPDKLVNREEIEEQMRFVNGAAMFVSREFLETIGLMQEDYFLYWEEIDWASRAKGKFKLGYAPSSIVYHKVGASIGTSDFGELSPLSDYYMARSQLKFCLRFSKVSLPFVLFDIGRNMYRWVKKGKSQRAMLLGRAIVGLPYVKPS